METYQEIIVWVILFFAVVGFFGSIAYMFYYFKERSAYNAIKPQPDLEYKPTGSFTTSASMKYIPTDTPFEDLWRDAGCSIYADMSIAGFCNFDLGHCKDKESLYRTELIRLIKEGKDKSLYVPPDDRNIDLRKFCIERTTSMPDNAYRDTVGILRTTDMLYDYILTGKIPEKKKDNNHG